MYQELYFAILLLLLRFYVLNFVNVVFVYIKLPNTEILQKLQNQNNWYLVNTISVVIERKKISSTKDTFRSLLTIRWHMSPSCAAAIAVARIWLDLMPPVVVTCLQPFFIASASKNSSFLTWNRKIWHILKFWRKKTDYLRRLGMVATPPNLKSLPYA